jgi:hypothetical protein
MTTSEPALHDPPPLLSQPPFGDALSHFPECLPDRGHAGHDIPVGRATITAPPRI